MRKLREILESKGNSELFNDWREHTKSFSPPERTFKGKDGREYTLQTKRASIGSQYYNVSHKDEPVGSFYLRSNHNMHTGKICLSVSNAGVEPKHQRNRIATNVYSIIEKDTKHLGLDLLPQGEMETSDEGKAFWKSYNPTKLKKAGME